MADRPAAPRRPGPARGVLHGAAPDGLVAHDRVAPSAPLAGLVAHFWSVRWALASPFTAETLPHPSVHVVIEWGPATAPRAEVAGVPTARFVRELRGEAQVFGIKFRPAAFRAWLRAPVAGLTDRVVPLRDVLGGEADALVRAVVDAPDAAARVAGAEAFLAPRLRPLSPEAAALRDLVERMAVDRSLVRADAAAALLGVDLRTLQRRFREHVGVTPKWVIGRYRLHEAAERLKAGDAPALADLAAELGYADQAHFAREFKRAVGRPPRSYGRER
jgi:AraC-like DNA-binding protein